MIITGIMLLLILQCALLIWWVWQSRTTHTHSQAVSVALNASLAELSRNQDRIDTRLQEALLGFRQELLSMNKANREETASSLKSQSETLVHALSSISQVQKNQLDSFSNQLGQLTTSNHERLEALRTTLENRLTLLQQDNTKKLDEMRQTVDEKLHATLEKRLGESFQHVAERLEKVHQGLGEMQVLASGVGDLKKVLTNVKTRGVWGEIQLGNLLEQILTPDQYEKNVKIRPDATGYVEFAVKLPGQGDAPVWLPIDAKFPQDAYQQLMAAQDQANPEAVDFFEKQLEERIKLSAKEISQKYIFPPFSTDFAILFLPIEGLYAEILRRPGLSDVLQQQYRVILAGPTTIAALLNSLKMGFRTLQIQKRSSEVWGILGQVKSEFGKFGDLLEKTHKKLQEAGNTIEDASRKTRTIERRLKDVQEPLQIFESEGELIAIPDTQLTGLI